jgi:hypothetical protein
MGGIDFSKLTEPAGKLMDSKFRGHCPACKSKIEAGTPIYYQFEHKIAVHRGCAEAIGLLDRVTAKPFSKVMTASEMAVEFDRHLKMIGVAPIHGDPAGAAKIATGWGGTGIAEPRPVFEEPKPVSPPAQPKPKPAFDRASFFRRISPSLIGKIKNCWWDEQDEVFTDEDGDTITAETMAMQIGNLELTCWQKGELAAETSPRVLFWGPPGTGKTHFGYHTSLAGREVFSCTLTRYDSASVLKGWFDSKPGEGLVWTDGPGIQAWLFGARLVINEIHKAGEDMIGFLHCLLDDPDITRITLPDGRTVRPTGDFQVIATMNGDPQELLDAALLDRFPASIHIDRVHPGALERLPTHLRTIAERSVLVDDPERQLSIRKWLEFHRLSQTMGNLAAAQIIFGARASELLDAIKMTGN